MDQKPFWEETYRLDGTPDTFSGGKPSQYLVEALENHFKGISILDLGCGEGRNSLYSAMQGFEVTAVDISKAGIEKTLRLAKERGVPVNALVGDMRQFQFPQNYDLTVCTGCLHLLKRSEWQKLLQDIMNHTSPDGLNVIEVFTDQVPISDDLKAFVRGLFDEGELFKQYEGWRIVRKESRIFDDQHCDGIKHTHASNRIIAQKINPTNEIR